MAATAARTKCGTARHSHAHTTSINAALPAVGHTDIAATQRDHPVLKDLDRVGARIHQIELGRRANRALALQVGLVCELERVRVGEVCVRRRDCPERSSWDCSRSSRTSIGSHPQCWPADHRRSPWSFREGRPAPDRGPTANISSSGCSLAKCRVVASRHALRLAADLSTDLLEVKELLAAGVKEFAVLHRLGCVRRRCVRRRW